MQATVDKIWTQTTDQIRTLLNTETYNLWFSTVQPVSLNQSSITLEVPNEFSEVWLKDNYLELLQDALATASGRKLNIKFTVADGAAPAPAKPARGKKSATAKKVSDGDLVFNPRNTFDTFVVGNNNSFAHAAAMAVAQQPGKAYNPLFLYGGTGLGKTHLLHAVGQHVVSTKKGAKVSYVSSEKVTNE